MHLAGGKILHTGSLDNIISWRHLYFFLILIPILCPDITSLAGSARKTGRRRWNGGARRYEDGRGSSLVSRTASFSLFRRWRMKMRVTRRRLVLISDRANDVPLPGSRAANTQAASTYICALPAPRRFMGIYLVPRGAPVSSLNKFRRGFVRFEDPWVPRIWQ